MKLGRSIPAGRSTLVRMVAAPIVGAGSGVLTILQRFRVLTTGGCWPSENGSSAKKSLTRSTKRSGARALPGSGLSLTGT